MKKVLFTIIALISAMMPVNAQEEELNLISTNTLDGMKCEHYVEGIRIYRRDNGDYLCMDENNLGQDYQMSRNSSPDSKIWGTFKFHTEEGIIVERVKDTLDTGEIIYGLTYTYPNGGIMGHSITAGTVDNKIYYSSGNRLFNAFVNQSFGKLWGVAGGELMFYNFGEMTLMGERFFIEPAFKKDNRLYRVNDYGSLACVAQLVNGKSFCAIESDSIISEKEVLETINGGYQESYIYVTYANGDNVKLSSDGKDIINASIHRNGDLITIKKVNGKFICIIKYANGDKFVGQNNAFGIKDRNGILKSFCIYCGDSAQFLTYTEIFPWEGLMTKADGTSYEIKEGQTPEAIAAQKKAEEAKQAAQYNDLCKQFGKQYVDAVLRGEIIVGMPEKLLLAAFKTYLHEEGANYKIYRISGFGFVGNTFTNNALKYSVWVKDGKVSNIKYWR